MLNKQDWGSVDWTKENNVIADEMANDFGNASSTHTLGRKARNSVEKARHTIAQAINAKDQEIIFTSGGSESNNTVIFGVAEMQKTIGRHLITTKIEHESVAQIAKAIADFLTPAQLDILRALHRSRIRLSRHDLLVFLLPCYHMVPPLCNRFHQSEHIQIYASAVSRSKPK